MFFSEGASGTLSWSVSPVPSQCASCWNLFRCLPVVVFQVVLLRLVMEVEVVVVIVVVVVVIVG